MKKIILALITLLPLSAPLHGMLTGKKITSTKPKTVARLSRPLLVAFSPNSKHLAIAYQANSISTIEIYDIDSHNCCKTKKFEGDDDITDMIFSSDGEQLLLLSTRDRRPDAKIITLHLKNNTTKAVHINTHREPCRNARFSENGTYIALALGLEYNSYPDVFLFDCEANKVIKAYHGEFECFSSTKDETFFALSSSSSIYFYNLTADVATQLIWQPFCLLTANAATQLIGQPFCFVDFTTLSPNGLYCAYCSDTDGTIKILKINKGWRASNWLCKTPVGHETNVTALTFTPDSEYLVSAGLDRTIRCWDPETGICDNTINGAPWNVSKLTFSPNGEYLAVISREGENECTLTLYNFIKRAAYPIKRSDATPFADVTIITTE